MAEPALDEGGCAAGHGEVEGPRNVETASGGGGGLHTGTVQVLEYMLVSKAAWTGGELSVGVLKGEENTNMFN